MSRDPVLGRLSLVSPLRLTPSYALLTSQEEFAATFFFVVFLTSKLSKQAHKIHRGSHPSLEWDLKAPLFCAQKNRLVQFLK